MGKNRWWIGVWVAITALWTLYWTGLGMALGMEGIREMIAGLPVPLLFLALCLSVPAALFLAGHIVIRLGCSHCRPANAGEQRS